MYFVYGFTDLRVQNKIDDTTLPTLNSWYGSHMKWNIKQITPINDNRHAQARNRVRFLRDISHRNKRYSEDPWCYVMEGVVKKTAVNQGARGAAAGTKMTVPIKSRQRNATAARCHPSRGANAWRGQMKCDLIRHSLIPRSFTTYAVTKKNKEPHLIRAAKSYVLFTMDGETTNPTNLTFKTSDNLFNSEHF